MVQPQLINKTPQHCTLWGDPQVYVKILEMKDNVKSVMKVGDLVESMIKFKLDGVISEGNINVEVHKDGIFMGSIKTPIREVLTDHLPITSGIHTIHYKQPLVNIITGLLNIKIKVVVNGRVVTCLMSSFTVKNTK